MALIHTEIQGNTKHTLPGDYLNIAINCTSITNSILPLVVLSDDKTTWCHQPFEISVFGHVTIRYDFLSVKLLDWKGQEEKLLESSNPFENLIAIYLQARKTKRHPMARLKSKMAIFNNLANKVWEQDDIVSFYTFLDGVMRLPKKS